MNEATGGHFPPSGSPAVRQLDPESELMQQLQSTPLTPNVHYVSIGGTQDFVVPANRIHLEGADEVVVDVNGWNDHHAIPRDANALRAVRAALEQRPLPCTSLMTGIRSAVIPVVYSRVEGDLGENILAYLDVREYAR